MPSELTDELRATLERVGDDWTDVYKFPIGHMLKLVNAGLIEGRSPPLFNRARRTPAGRAALGSGG